MIPRSHRQKPYQAFSGLPGVAVAVLMLSCAPPEPSTSPGPATLGSLRTEYESTLCDTPAFTQLAERIAAVNARRRGDEPVVSTAAESLPVSTVHDCQRLIVHEQLGPLAGLYVSEERVVAGPFDEGTVVADIVNYGPGEYTPLGLRPGLNCLWLQRNPDLQSWSAAMLRPGANGCASVNPNNPGATRLRVLAYSYGGSEYPSTGRWMWDPESGEQFIGARCGMAWCEMGSANFKTTTSITRRDQIPGWYDEQRLSYWDSDAGMLRLSTLTGRIEPGADLRGLHGPAAHDRAAGHAATIILSGDDPEAREFYHHQLALDNGVNRHKVWLRWKRELVFDLPPWEKVHRFRVRHHRWTRVEYSGHSHAGPNAVRWAWSEQDEGVWAPCDEGCCKGSSAKRAE